jgi:hypothetical protein
VIVKARRAKNGPTARNQVIYNARPQPCPYKVGASPIDRSNQSPAEMVVKVAYGRLILPRFHHFSCTAEFRNVQIKVLCGAKSVVAPMRVTTPCAGERLRDAAPRARKASQRLLERALVRSVLAFGVCVRRIRVADRALGFAPSLRLVPSGSRSLAQVRAKGRRPSRAQGIPTSP